MSSNNEENSQLSQNMQNFCVAAGSSTKVKKPFKKVLPLFSTPLLLHYFPKFSSSLPICLFKTWFWGSFTVHFDVYYDTHVLLVIFFAGAIIGIESQVAMVF